MCKGGRLEREKEGGVERRVRSAKAKAMQRK